MNVSGSTMTDKIETLRPKNGGIHLIASNKNHEFEYGGFCKIVINHLKSLLFVEPFNEEFKLISAMFKWKFWAQKVNDKITNDQIYQRILKPIFNQVTRISNITISELLKNWMNKLDLQDKETYIRMMKNDEIYDLIYANVESVEENVTNMNNESEDRIKRKRRFSKINTKTQDEDVSDITRIKTQKCSSVNFVKSDCEFKIVNIKGKTKLLKRMLIFSSSDKAFCYEYSQNRFKQNIYCCYGCRKMSEKVYAKIEENENLLLQKKEHVCSKIPYSAETYFDLQIVRKRDYEILENCNTKNGKVLIIFNPNDRTQCHECFGGKSMIAFRCSGCRLTAVVNNISMKNEYVEILKNHECQFRPYDPDRFYKFKNFVLAPNFKIQKKVNSSKEKKTLIIFDEKDKSKCYKYSFHNSENLFVCWNCLKQRLRVSAKLLQNSDGENYVILSNVQHVCESEEYIPQNEDIILRSPDFKFMEENLTGTPKLFIFDSEDKNVCYVFSRISVEKSCNQYRCMACQNIVHKKSGKKNINSRGVVVYLYFCKDENGEYFVQMKKQKHVCQPRKYEPEKYEISEAKMAQQYFYFKNKSFPKSANVALLHSTDSTLCYSFLYSKSMNCFRCMNCQKLKGYYSIPPPKMNENEKEYFNHDQEKHACEPIKTASIQTSKFQKIGRNELTFKEKSKKKELKIDQNRIVKLPNFEIRPNRKGNPEGKLVVFDRNEKSLCYEYYYYNRGKIFVCSKCQKKKHRVTAKVHFEKENNEKFIELSKNEHICEQIKDEFKDKIINPSDFLVINRDDETKLTKIILFTSESKDFYHELTYCASNRCFICHACSILSTFGSVKLNTKENSEEYLLKTNNEHVCTPKQFEPLKTVPESMFELYQNTKGEENKKLIVFTSEKKDFVYEYYWNKNSYLCSKCKNQNKYVNAKLLDKENEKYLELSNVEHICIPKKYDHNNYKK